ncbi:MAG: DUF3127 domain-containing protein [Bacteroidales bacterium]|jgi:hypothetical protein|nr:DUF3127 domain-containing protein [Bacteroidales bacterium]MBR7004139.1 DUF3127 domain-containing protein [Bacteroidales bacterium]
MAALELEGRISQKFAKQSGQSARGPWMKQDFILEFQDGSYTSEVCFTSFGNERVAELDRFQAGDEVKVSFNLRAREFNGRWYNDVRVWRISPAGQPSQQPVQSPQPQLTQQAPPPSLDDMPAEDDSNDLPF